METAILQAYKVKKQPQVVRYADDFAIFHPTEEGVQKAQTVVESWLREIGLELKPSKTRISHTLTPYQGNIGMDFLGFTIRQTPVGKNRTGTNGHGQPLGFKTIITPSKEAIQGQIRKVGAICKKCQAASQERLIRQLNPVIRGWSNYYRAVVSKVVFSHCDHAVYEITRSWARRRHPYKNGYWMKDRYWKTDETRKWIFRDQEGHTLRNHSDTAIRRHVKVKGNASPYDGNFLYWSKRLRHHPMLYGKLARLLQKQQGKCRWCELTFRNGDRVEIDHITLKNQGGGDELSNLMALHRHCHDQRHARNAEIGIHDKDARIEEPDDGKLSRPVLKAGRKEQSFLPSDQLTILQKDTKRTKNKVYGTKRRSINGGVGLRVPRTVVRDKCDRYKQHNKVMHRTELLNESDYTIIATYQLEFRGIANYYRLAYNLHTLQRLKWVMEQSLSKTLATKHHTSVQKIMDKYKAELVVEGIPYKGLRVSVPREGKKPLVATWGGIPLKWDMQADLEDRPQAHWNPRSELEKRLLAQVCEHCKATSLTDEIEVHHIRALKDLDRYTGRDRPFWVKIMAARRRKTLVLCRTCHRDIHAGHPVRRHTSSP